MCIALLDALGVQYVVIALYQWFDWGTDILFLDAEIYGSEFRKHPSFAATRTAAIFFDVTGFIALVWALRRKAMFQLRIRKAEREGKFEGVAQRKRFEKVYLGGQTFMWTAWVLFWLEDLPEAVITVHVIQATPGGMSSIAWLAVITSCGGVVYAFGNYACCNPFAEMGVSQIDHDYYDGDTKLGTEIFNDEWNAPGLCALLHELSMEDAKDVQERANEMVEHARA